ncbi:MAG: hypothetical protein JKY19_03310, partial [Alcanivoracaceae bacterium]|nr:hypothetical protein [Alcanivoracaceae bacterium]
EIQIYDVRKTAVNEEMVYLTTIKKDDGINGAGMTKQIDGDKSYIVMAGDNNDLYFYKSNKSTLDSDTTFKLLNTTGTLPVHTGGSGFALVTQADGQLYFFAMHASDGKESTVKLFKLDIDGNDANVIPIFDGDGNVDTKNMDIPGISDTIKGVKKICDYSGGWGKYTLPGFIVDKICTHVEPVKQINTSFRWGKGLRVQSPTSIEIFATDRNILPNPSDKNFGVVTWQGSSVPTVDWGSSVKYSTGSNLAFAMNDSDKCIEMHRGSEGGDNKDMLNHKIGKIDSGSQTISWNSSIPYNSGSDCAIAMNKNQYCIEVHRGSGSSKLLYSCVGKFDYGNNNISWGESDQYTTGSNLAIAMNNTGYCVEVNRGADDDSTNLYYRVGEVDYDGLKINWHKVSEPYDIGSDLAIAMDDLGRCVEIHRGPDDTDDDTDLYYRVGKVDYNSKIINWYTKNSHQFTHGSVVSIAMHNNGTCISVHRHSDGSEKSNEHSYNVGVVDFESGKINWSSSQKYSTGFDLAVAMDNLGHCIEVHRGSEGSDNRNNHYYKFGVFTGA